MSGHRNIIPDEYLNELLAVDKKYTNKHEWEEMNDSYYVNLRGRFNKGPNDIGPRDFKTFKGNGIPVWLIVIPAGSQSLSSNPSVMTQHFHTIYEDMELGECNGSYKLITEEELETKFNIKYNII